MYLLVSLSAMISERMDILACKTAALEDIRGDTDLPNHQSSAVLGAY